MKNLEELYKRIDYLRNGGVKMKEIADWIDLAPSILSSLYTTVLPVYFKLKETSTSEEALDNAFAQVNNVSKRRFLNGLDKMLERLDEMEPAKSVQTEIPFLDSLKEEMQLSVYKFSHISGLYYSYSLSSSSDRLKIEPLLISPVENDYLRIGRLSAYGILQWGIGFAGDPQNFYCLFSESSVPPIILVTLYLQIPLFNCPKQIRGLYLGLDYNHTPISRRVLLIKESESTDVEDLKKMTSGMINKEELTSEQQSYYDYTCQQGDYIKMCTVPSLQMDETDLIKEKKMLAL